MPWGTKRVWGLNGGRVSQGQNTGKGIHGPAIQNYFFGSCPHCYYGICLGFICISVLYQFKNPQRGSALCWVVVFKNVNRVTETGGWKFSSRGRTKEALGVNLTEELSSFCYRADVEHQCSGNSHLTDWIQGMQEEAKSRTQLRASQLAETLRIRGRTTIDTMWNTRGLKNVRGLLMFADRTGTESGRHWNCQPFVFTMLQSCSKTGGLKMAHQAEVAVSHACGEKKRKLNIKEVFEILRHWSRPCTDGSWATWGIRNSYFSNSFHVSKVMKHLSWLRFLLFICHTVVRFVFVLFFF